MKKLLFILLSALFLFAGCTQDLQNQVDDMEKRLQQVEELCQEMNSNIASLQTLVEALQNNDYVTGVEPIKKDGKTIGYTITFSKSGKIDIYHGQDGADGQNGKDGKDGQDGQNGYTPVIGVARDADGVYYWTLDGEWILDDNGNKIPVEGKDSPAPEMKIENGNWWISYDGGSTWTEMGPAAGDSFFQEVNVKEDCIEFVLSDGTVFTVPMASSSILQRLQSVTYVSEYADGCTAVDKPAGAVFHFRISPKDLIPDLVKDDLWKEVLSVQAYYTKERDVMAMEFIDMPLMGFEVDEANSMISVKASGENLSEAFFSGMQKASAMLIVSDGNFSFSSESIALVPGIVMPAAVSEFADDFGSITSAGKEYDGEGWRFYSTNESTGWRTGFFNKGDNPEKSLEIKAYKISEPQVSAYAMMTPFNVKAAQNRTLNFSLAYYYKNFDDTRIEVVASTDFKGSIADATWEVVQDCTFAETESKNTQVAFSVDLSKYADCEYVAVAFRYVGKELTYRIYNVRFNETVKELLQVESLYDPNTMSVDFHIVSPTKNVKTIYYSLPIPQIELSVALIEEGFDIVTYMESIVIPWGMAVAMTAEQLEQVNGDGLTISMGSSYGMETNTDQVVLFGITDNQDAFSVVREDFYYGTK